MRENVFGGRGEGSAASAHCSGCRARVILALVVSLVQSDCCGVDTLVVVVVAVVSLVDWGGVLELVWQLVFVGSGNLCSGLLVGVLSRAVGSVAVPGSVVLPSAVSVVVVVLGEVVVADVACTVVLFPVLDWFLVYVMPDVAVLVV